MLKSAAWLVNYGGRVFLTLLVLFAFLVIWNMWAKVHASFMASQNDIRKNPIYIGNHTRPTPSDPMPHPFWPEFPRPNPGTVQSAVIDGVEVVTENWFTTASSAEVLSYYRDQMIAQGWRDTTEETFSQQPQAIKGHLQDQKYIDNYNKIMASNLVLSRPGWTIHITVDPSTVGFNQNEVKFYAAATDSVQNFVTQIQAPLVDAKDPNARPFDAVQQSGGDLYHTTMATERQSPAQTFQEAMEKYNAQGWRPAIIMPKQMVQNSYFAWLVRGKQYAALSVHSLTKDGLSSVTFTEVTPKSDQR